MLMYFDKNDQLISSIGSETIAECYMEQNVRGADRLEATLYAQPPRTAMYVAHLDEFNLNTLHHYYLQQNVLEGNLWRITGIESGYDDLRTSEYVEDIRPTRESLQVFGARVLAGSRWTNGNVLTSRTVTGSYYWLSKLETMQKIVEENDVEFEMVVTFSGSQIVGRTVNWYDQIGADRGVRYVYGDRLLRLVAEETRDKIYTALIGKGKGEKKLTETGEETGGYGRKIDFTELEWSVANGDPVDKPAGQAYVVDPVAVDEYGLRIGLVEFSEIEDRTELLEATYEQLATSARPKATFTAEVREQDEVKIGDTVTIKRTDLGIAYKTRVNKRTVNLLHPSQVQIEVGDKIGSYTKMRLEGAESSVKQLDGKTETAYEAVESLILGRVKTYWGEDGYTYDLRAANSYGLPAGLYSFDAPIETVYPDPSLPPVVGHKVIYFGAGKLLVSNEIDVDGNWLFRTILDGDGLGTGTVGASQVIAGSLTTDIIWFGTGQSATTATQAIETAYTTANDARSFADSVAGDLAEEVNARNTYISRDPVTGLIQIGDIQSDYVMKLGSDTLGFYYKGLPDPVAYFEVDKLMIKDAEILVSLNIGNFAFEPRVNSNLSFNKVV